MSSEKERRVSNRMEKAYQVFCRVGNRNSIGESFNVSEKGVGVYTDLDLQIGDPVEVRIVPKDEIFSFTCEGTVRYSKPSKDGVGFKYMVGVEFMEGLKDFALDQLVGMHEHINARKSIVINASQQECYETISNYESYPTWQKVIKSVKVLERASDTRPIVVEFIIDALLKKVRIVNKYEYFDKDYILSWKLVEGDIKVNDGNYVFQKLREGRTNAIFSVYLELGFFAPKRILDYLNNISMRSSIRSLKEVVETGTLKKKK